MEPIRIGERLVGPGQPRFIIAEIGINHNGSLKVAKDLIDRAIEAGAEAVKFQKRSLDHLYHPDILNSPNSAEQAFQYMIPLLREVELPDDAYRHLFDYCRRRGVTFLCSPWDVPSLEFLESLGVAAYKMGSADMTNFPLLEHVVAKGKPMLVSTGMATLEEIEKTVAFLRGLEARFMLLHCNSTYPTPFEEINLRFMDRLREFGVPVGYSGHERGICISVVAAAMGACAVERHITLDRTMVGPDHAASLEPQGFAKMVRDIRQMETAMGSGRKHMSRMEIMNRDVLGKSLVAARDIPRGALIEREMVTAKGPGKGVAPYRLYELVGRVARRDIKKDEFFTLQDLGEELRLRAEGGCFGRWGFVLRLSELPRLKEIDSQIVEVRLSDKDVEDPLPPLAAYGQELIVHAPEYWFRSLVDISAADEGMRRRSVAAMKKVVARAKEIARHFRGRPKMVIHPGGMSIEYLGHAEELNWNMERSLRELEEEGIELLPENLPPRPWYFGGEYFSNNFIAPEEITRYCQEYKRPICFDLSHAQLYCNHANVDIVDFLQAVRPWIGHLHVSDGYGVHGEGVQIGEGDIDFKRVVPLLADYEGGWIPEIWRGHLNDFEGFYTAIARLSSLYRTVCGPQEEPAARPSRRVA